MENNGKKFLIITSIMALGLVGGFVKGKNQKSEREMYYKQFIQSQMDIQQGNNTKDSLEIIENMEKHYIKDTSIVLQKALAYEELKEYDKVQTTFEEAFELDENLLNNFAVLTLYAQSTHHNKDSEALKMAMDKINTLQLDEEQKQKLEELKKLVG